MHLIVIDQTSFSIIETLLDFYAINEINKTLLELLVIITLLNIETAIILKYATKARSLL